MDKQWFEKELIYEATMAIFRRLLESKSISEDDYSHLESMMKQKYSPLLASLSEKRLDFSRDKSDR